MEFMSGIFDVNKKETGKRSLFFETIIGFGVRPYSYSFSA